MLFMMSLKSRDPNDVIFGTQNTWNFLQLLGLLESLLHTHIQTHDSSNARLNRTDVLWA